MKENLKFKTFLSFTQKIDAFTGRKIKALQTNNRGEFLALQPFHDQHGISHLWSCPYIHQQMGFVKRQHHHIVDI